MSKKKKARKRQRTPPLSFLDKCIYGVGTLLAIAIFIAVFFFFYTFPSRYGLRDSFVSAVAGRISNLWFFPIWFYIVISLLGIISIPWALKKPLFGNSQITYGPPHWVSIYPLFGKQKKKRQPLKKTKKGIKIFVFGWLAIFLAFSFLSVFSLFGRNALMQNGDITVYGVYDQEKYTYSVKDIATLEIRTGFYTPSRSFREICRTEYAFTMNDGRYYEFTNGHFRSVKDAFEAMLHIKILVDRQKITIKGVENLDKLMVDQNYSPSEIKLLYELFEVKQ